MKRRSHVVPGPLLVGSVMFVILACGSISRGAELPEAKPEDVGMSSAKLALIVPAMQKLIDEDKCAGAGIIVARKGQIVQFEAIGKQNIAASQPMTRDSIVRIYSMTKPITTTAIMMLIEEGKLALDDPVSKYLSELQNLEVFTSFENGELHTEPPAREMTIRDLLRHTSGLTYGFFGETEVDKRYRQANVLNPSGTLDDLTKTLATLPLLYQPGTRFNYSVSTDLLGRIVEVVSDQTLDEFFEQRIFKPLDMLDTAFYVPADKLPRFAANYNSQPNGGLQVADDPVTSTYRQKPHLLSGGGGLVSTARDYLRFCQMLINQGEFDGVRLLRAETVAEMSKNQLPAGAYPINLNGPRPGVGFGLGFSVIQEETPYTTGSRIAEFGWGGAASTHFWISPRDELAVVVLTQLMPFTFQMETIVKPMVYDAIEAKE